MNCVRHPGSPVSRELACATETNGSHDLPSMKLGAVTPAMSRIVGAMSTCPTANATVWFVTIPGPRTSSGTRTWQGRHETNTERMSRTKCAPNSAIYEWKGQTNCGNLRRSRTESSCHRSSQIRRGDTWTERDTPTATQQLSWTSFNAWESDLPNGDRYEHTRMLIINNHAEF